MYGIGTKQTKTQCSKVDLFSNLKIHQRNKKPTTKKPPLTPPKEGAGVVSYRLAKRSTLLNSYLSDR
ncbi:MAG: hypothetical protein LBC74_02130 [Planctomycetaceae bacterium]|nr:hypothetical protein [Planctomycetaceae bacterium]